MQTHVPAKPLGRGGCPGGSSPEEMAELYATYLSEEHLELFIGWVEELIETLGDTERAKYWADVLEALE